MSTACCLSSKPSIYLQIKGEHLIEDISNRKIFASLMHCALKNNWAALPVHELAVKVGRFFLNTPYGSSTLEAPGEETLVVNFRQVDCVTFIEYVVVLTRLIRDKATNIDTFAAILQKVRYRDGIIKGYASRLHYFSDWLYDNQLKGFLIDIAETMGGKSCKKKINFMTRHPELYPALNEAAPFKEMLQVEETLRSRPFHRIPKTDSSSWEEEIKDGDILGITSSKTGLDVMHVAMAIHIEGKLHLLHASCVEGRVVVSGQTLREYLDEKPERTGIMVGRIL
jgi:hypothetical protein